MSQSMLRCQIFGYLIHKHFSNKSLFGKTMNILELTNCRLLSLTKSFDNIIERKKKTISDEREFLVRLKTDPDTFGLPKKSEIFDEGDLREEKYFTEQPLPQQRLQTKQYADIIKSLINDRRIKEAIDVVEVRMLKQDRVKPEAYIYNLLLGACGRIGYTKKAFMLYNDMKKRGLSVTGGTYTALFNACANSPWPENDGLTRAHKLYNIIVEKGYEPNDPNFNAMIKAFGRCGDLPMAFSLVDEMAAKGFQIKDDTMNFMLQACITDKEAGFRHALLVWRKLVEKNIKPTIYTYNLMLRAIKQCGLGDMEATQDVINKLVSSLNQQLLKAVSTKLVLSTEGNSLVLKTDITVNSNTASSIQNPKLETNALIDSELVQVNKITLMDSMPPEAALPDVRPNLMAETPHLGNIISLTDITKPEERLLLVGGCKAFLENMQAHGCLPDIKTFTQLLDLIPSTLAAETKLLKVMKKLKVLPDVSFYNMLIKKRSMRCDYKSAREVVELLRIEGYRPNLLTYGILAMGCKTKDECLELVEIMKQSKYSLNAEILGAMLHQACYHKNINYILHILEICQEENIQPNKKFMEKLAEFKRSYRNLSKAQRLPQRQLQRFCEFKNKYEQFLQTVQVDDSEDAHPWQQYRQLSPENVKYKWNDADNRFKPRHISLFKVKTSPKHKLKQNSIN